ncbi:MAG: endonuclease, partial [Thermoplasmatales archaeon]|nr:endonuclease [Thermoplasmatales archaeon]
RFIGSPIDGVQFEDDQILFVEFKTDKSKLNAKQNKIKKLVKEGKVKWFEFKTK